MKRAGRGRANATISFMQRRDVPRGAININDGLLLGSLDNAGCVSPGRRVMYTSVYPSRMYARIHMHVTRKNFRETHGCMPLYRYVKQSSYQVSLEISFSIESTSSIRLNA